MYHVRTFILCTLLTSTILSPMLGADIAADHLEREAQNSENLFPLLHRLKASFLGDVIDSPETEVPQTRSQLPSLQALCMRKIIQNQNLANQWEEYKKNIFVKHLDQLRENESWNKINDKLAQVQPSYCQKVWNPKLALDLTNDFKVKNYQLINSLSNEHKNLIYKKLNKFCSDENLHPMMIRNPLDFIPATLDLLSGHSLEKSLQKLGCPPESTVGTGFTVIPTAAFLIGRNYVDNDIYYNIQLALILYKIMRLYQTNPNQ